TQHRTPNRRNRLTHDEAQHDPIRFENERERRFFADKSEAEFAAVKLLGACDIYDGEKSDDVVFAKSGSLRHGTMMSGMTVCRNRIIASGCIVSATAGPTGRKRLIHNWAPFRAGRWTAIVPFVTLSVF